MIANSGPRFRLSPAVVDWTVALLLTAYVQGVDALFDPESGFSGSPILTLTALLITVPLAWRRRWPLPVFGLVLAGIVITFTSGVTAHAALVWGTIVCITLAAYSVGSCSRHRLLSLAALGGTATLILTVFGGTLPAPPDILVPYVLLLLPWLVGNAIRVRQQQVDIYRAETQRLEREREFATRAALAEQRTRIARELHDVVAHHVSVMVVQAGAARQVLDTAPDKSRDALLTVEETGRTAMAELRNLLGVLGNDGLDPALAPQPGMADLDGLIDRVREAGLPVELRIEGQPRGLPPGVDLAAFRIVQEALTNALKYSGLAHTDVILDYRDRELKLEVLDEGTAGQRAKDGPEPGRGLVGMRERVALFGGMLEAGPRLSGGYAVRAWLPLPGAES